MKSFKWRCMLASAVFIAMTAVTVGNADAQCSTCVSPPAAYQTVTAYQPVVAQPTVAYQPYTGWYPGKWLDQWRMRRATVATTAPTYSAPAYTAAYAPAYSASYAPTYQAAYRPYVTSYAPLSAPAAPACNTCAQTAYYPVTQTVARQVLLRPVVVAPACNTCSFTPSCGCDSCSSSVSQATYTQPACSSCAGGGTVLNVVPPADNYNYGANVGPQTPVPTMSAEPAPANSQYRSNRPAGGADASKSKATVNDIDVNEIDPLEKLDPGPAGSDIDSSTFYNAPQLLDPRDRTARNSRKPTVNVWNAVYRNTAANRKVSQTSRRPVTRTRAEINADAWSAVPPSGR